MTKSESIGALAKALVAFQNDFGSIDKNSKVDVKNKEGKFLYSFNYTTLDHILDVARPHMKTHGLALSQMLSEGGLTTILMHTSGEWLEDFTSFAGISYKSAQELGSAITYLRRYAVTSALGISADEDDDGNVNAGNNYERSSRAPSGGSNGRSASKPKSIMGEILDAAKALWGEDAYNDELNALTKGKMVKDLPPKRQADLLAHINSLMGIAE